MFAFVWLKIPQNAIFPAISEVLCPFYLPKPLSSQPFFLLSILFILRLFMFILLVSLPLVVAVLLVVLLLFLLLSLSFSLPFHSFIVPFPLFFANPLKSLLFSFTFMYFCCY